MPTRSLLDRNRPVDHLVETSSLASCPCHRNEVVGRRIDHTLRRILRRILLLVGRLFEVRRTPFASLPLGLTKSQLA